jgi:hypothetical protein
MFFARSNSKKLAAVAVLSVSAMLGAVSQIAKADDNTAKQALDQGKALFAQRSSTNLKSIEDALTVLATAEAQAQDKVLKYDILVLESRALYFKGTHTAGDANKKTIHAAGQAKADAAEALTSDYAEAQYFAGINLARWGEANGIIASLTQVPKLKKYMANAMDRSTRDGNDGESVDGFGPHRTLGRMLKKLPGMFGGNHAESVKELDKAVAGDATLALNVVYLADSLIKDGNDSEKAQGRQLLNDLLAKDPATLNRDRLAETGDEFQFARDVLAGKEIQ